MHIRKLSICKYGGIDFFESELSETVLLCGHYSADLFRALCILLNSDSYSHNMSEEAKAGTSLAVTVTTEDKIYLVNADRTLRLSAHLEDGTDCTAEYLSLTSPSCTDDGTNTFSLESPGLEDALRPYLREEKKRRLTGIKGTEFFRAYLREFISAFQPERLVPGKPYFIHMSETGSFYPANENYPSEEAVLSDMEKIVFRFLCFLHAERFWTTLEKVRNIHYEPKPLIISGLFERLDEAMDPNYYIDRAAESGGQMLFLSETSTSENRNLSNE